MQRKLTSASSLDNLRKEAKRWLKALRENNPEARERLVRVYPKAATVPVLRDVQHALALEYGLTNWKDLKAAIHQAAATTPPSAGPRPDVVSRFLECACPDHHVRGRPAHRMARHAALLILEQNPEIASESIYTAAVCGELEAVKQFLRDQPQLANLKRPATGPDRSGGGASYDFLSELGGKDWEPLLFLCFTRLPTPKVGENAVAIARLLLEHGADANAHFMAGDSRYSPLVGVVGEGEEDRPPHPHRDELARLLLEHGAEPYDIQVVYNIHFHGNILWWTRLMYEFSVKAGRRADWDDPEWQMLAMGGYGSGARWHLAIAVKNSDLELAEWCLSHGANPNSPPERDQRFAQQSLYEQAVRLGHRELAELLLRHGAVRVEVTLEAEERFVAACLRLDGAEARRFLEQHPGFLMSPKAMFAAASKDRADVVAFLLDLGTPLEVEDGKKQRTLHVAASHDAVQVAALLLERGAEPDPYEENWGASPLGFAVYREHARFIEQMRPHSRDIWNLVSIGAVDRVREVLRANPSLAKVAGETTPLFWLPEDEEAALEIARLFLNHGADAGFRSKNGGATAAETARKRGMHRVAALLDPKPAAE